MRVYRADLALKLTSAWIEGANEAAVILVGAAFLIWGSPNARALAGGCLGLIAVAVGMTRCRS